MKDKVTLKYNKKEGDIETHYPDVEGNIIGRNFYIMFKLFIAWKDNKDYFTQCSFQDYANYLEELGYDPTTIRITIKKKK